MAISFDLTTRPWLPVRQGDRLTLASLGDALLRARDYDRLEDPSPLVTGALHRLLLAVLHRALAGPDSAAQAARWLADGFPEQPIRDYLAQHRDRFDLFHPDTPFYQVADFTPDLSSRSWTILAAERNSDNNKVLFDHTVTSQPPPLDPATAARLLVANQTFALGGGRSYFDYTSSAPVATAALAIVQGDNLLETLCLNLVPYPEDQRRRDRATWEEPPLRVDWLRDSKNTRQAPLGIVHRYTWQARAIKLHPEDRDGTTTIRQIAYASGIRPEEAATGVDPMVALRRDRTDPSKSYPLAFREGRALWRDLHSLLPSTAEGERGAAVLEHARRVHQAHGKRNAAIPVLVVGQANDQAKVEFWRAELYRLPPAILGDHEIRHFVEERLAEAEETGSRLNGAARVAAQALLTLGERQPHKDDVTKLAASFPHQAAYWSALEEHFARWLPDLGGDDFDGRRDDHQRDWAQAIHAAASRAWHLTARALGDDARALRALCAAETTPLKYNTLPATLLQHLRDRRQQAQPEAA